MRNDSFTVGRRNCKAFLLLTVAVFIGIALITSTCRDQPTVVDTNDHLELISYIESNEDGRELFRTDGIIKAYPYTKPNRHPDVVFRDSLDSVSRQYFTDIPTYWEETDFGPPFGIVDAAEVAVTDIFYVRVTADSAGTPLITLYQQRVLKRYALFLRLRTEQDAYAGWLMYGYNGGVPRDGLLEITKSNGIKFRGDGLDFDEVDYLKYVSIPHTGDDGIVDSITVDTIPGSTRYRYILLQDIERVTRGDRLVVRGLDIRNESTYQIIAAETDTGAVYRLMNRPDIGNYVDTIKTPTTTDRLWNLITFFEFQFPDRPGGIWCVPYRAQ